MDPWGLPPLDEWQGQGVLGATQAAGVAAVAGPPASELTSMDLDLLAGLDPLSSVLWDGALPPLQPTPAAPAAPLDSGGGSGGGSGSGGGGSATTTGGAASSPCEPGSAGGAQSKRRPRAATARYDTPEARARKQAQQRTYRQRLKQKRDGQAAEVEATAAALEAARAEQAELLRHQQALLQLRDYRDSVAESLGGAPSPALQPTTPAEITELRVGADAWQATAELAPSPDAARRTAPPPSPPADAGADPDAGLRSFAAFQARVHARLLLSIPNGLWRRVLPSEAQLLHMATTLTPAQIVARDHGFRTLLRIALDEWEASGPSGRDKVERRLLLVWAVRVKALALLMQHCPDKLVHVMQLALMPGPTPEELTAGGCPVNPRVPAIVEGIDISPQQRISVLLAWQQYQLRMGECERTTASGIGAIRSRASAPADGADPPLSVLMQEYLDTLDAASGLAVLPRQQAERAMCLSLAVHEALSPLQCSRLMLACAPHIPDCTQICRYLEWQQAGERPASNWLRATVDSGHLLAASAEPAGP